MLGEHDNGERGQIVAVLDAVGISRPQHDIRIERRDTLQRGCVVELVIRVRNRSQHNDAGLRTEQ